MLDTLKKIFEGARTFFAELPPKKKILLGVLILIGAVVVWGTTLWVKHDPYQVLYTDLTLEDSRAVARKLGEVGIPYQLADENRTVSVPGGLVASARMQLAKDGIPGQDVVGFEKFDGSTLGMSSYVQRIQYVRAVQGELTRSIQQIAAVRKARVHISLPPKKVFMEEEEPPKASVVVELKASQTLSKSEVAGIAHLVASAVEGLKIDQVTIMDTKGGVLHRPEDAMMGGISSHLLEMQRTLEKDYERSIEELLIPVVGLGKVRAKVTAEIDPARVNTTEETFDPDKTVVKSTIKNDEVSQGSRPNPIGIPGSRSNLPGTEASNPPIPTANQSSERNMQNTQYSTPRKIQVTDRPSGTLKRLTVAVVVDGYYTKANGAEEAFTPRSEEELKRLQDIVANAVGYDAQRRDSITVSSLPFKPSELFAPEDINAGKFSAKDLLPLALKNGVIGIVALLFLFLILRPLVKSLTSVETEKQINLLPKTVAELEATRRDEGILALAKSVGMAEENEPLEKKEEAELKKRILERVDAAPKKGFRVVQDWLDTDQLAAVGEPRLLAS